MTAGSSSPAASAPLPFAPAPSTATSADSIPFDRGGDTAGGIGMPFALLICLAGFALAVTAWRRRRGGRLGLLGDRAVTVLESARLGDRTRLSVVRYRDRELLIGHGDQAITVLSDRPADGSPESAP